MISFAILSTTCHPPKQVPSPIAIAEVRMTQVGTSNVSRTPEETSRAVMTPTACWPSFAPWAVAWTRQASTCSGWKIRFIRFCREWRKRWEMMISKRNAPTMPMIGEMKMNSTIASRPVDLDDTEEHQDRDDQGCPADRPQHGTEPDILLKRCGEQAEA